LSFAELSGADLSYAMVVGAMLEGTNLTGTTLVHADLTLASFNGVRVANGDLTQTRWSKTVWARCEDLARARGLDTVRHGDPSSIDIHTLRAGIDHLPDDLLEHCGVQPGELAQLRRLLAR
jgi:hypothetical protein